jgi:PPM family protein phosphatase
MEIIAGSATDVGRVREHNEDGLAVDSERGLFIVSDGMGGAQAGELASKAVVTVLPKLIRKQLKAAEIPVDAVIERILRDAIVELGTQLYEQGSKEPGLKGMGATAVVVLIREGRAHIAHMGDSRVYLYREGALTQLTDDHSIVGILLRDGEITPEEARDHPARSQLSRYVGMPDEIHPDVQTIELLPGDRLLLCSDGLTGMIPDESIASILQSHPAPQPACDALIVAANEAGGKDNITAVLLHMD